MAKPTNSASIRKHLLSVRRSLSALDRSLERLTASLNGFGSGSEPRKSSTRRLSRRARAALKLQGRYMGYMRQLKPRQKAVVRAAKEKKGIGAAIARAQWLAKRRAAA